MRKLNFSLVIKIACIILLAFLAVLGNEIRLGIERYIKNTLETDAEITIRNLDKFAKNYVERIAVNPVDLSSQQFLRLYHHALSGDLTKVKCLVDADGKILDMSRDGVEGPSLSLIVEKDDTNYSVGIDFSSLSQKDLEKLEKVIIQHQNSQLDISIDVHIGQYNEFNGEMRNLDFKEIKVNNQTVIEHQVEGEITHIEGVASSYMSAKMELLFPYSADGLSYSSNLTQKAMLTDYHDAFNGLKQQIQKNFEQFKDSGKEFNSSIYDYTQYYLINPYEYNGKYYSTIMMRLEDWITPNQTQEEVTVDAATVGYIFITQEYENLRMKSLQQFMYDNSSTYILAIVLIIIMCFIVAYMIVRPIKQLELAAWRISRKQFEYPIDTSRHDELGDLARSVDKMSKELEKTINDLHQEIERVQQLEVVRKEFVSNFTHEIKTPLGIINGFSEMVELEQDEKKRNEYIQIIQNETRRINELVLAMLDLSKLESQNMTLDLEEVDLLDIVDESLESMACLFEAQKVHLKTDLDSSIIQADPFKIGMVITNYISNALRYTEAGEEVIIHLDEHCFSVENTGAHIPEEDIQKIWLSFHKVDKARNEGGTGLGLAICKAILELHHFEYGVENTPQGVLFYFKY